MGARYNPRTGTYARGAAAYGPYGARGVAQAYNPRTGTYAATRQGSNVYGSWGSTAVQRGDDWAKTNRYTNNRTGTTTRTVRTEILPGRGDLRGENALRIARATAVQQIALDAAGEKRRHAVKVGGEDDVWFARSGDDVETTFD